MSYVNVKGKIYRLSDTTEGKSIVTHCIEKTDVQFKRHYSCYYRRIDVIDINEWYDLKFVVEYNDLFLPEQQLWEVCFDNPRKEPLKANEIVLSAFGAIRNAGWYTNGRDVSLKIITVNECLRVYLRYTYYKKNGKELECPVCETREVSHDEFIDAIKLHREDYL